MKKLLLMGILSLSLVIAHYNSVEANSISKQPKPATTTTQQHNDELRAKLNRKSIKKESDLATRGLIASKPNLIVKRKNSQTNSWDMTKYAFLEGEAPPTVNPKLWEHAKLNMNIGLYQVSENIYQVRGFDLANITFIRGKTGYIVIDPLTVEETARAALEFVYEQLGEMPVTAVIFTHSHVDHYGGVYGVLNNDNPTVYAPSGFMDAVVSENLYAGTAMTRRSIYMYGLLLENGVTGQIDNGLGKRVAAGTGGLKDPDIIIEQPTETIIVDGVEMVFQLTNGTEAPSEMNIYIPSEQALCIAENCTATLHNLYTLRGAEVRDPEKWSDYLDQTIRLFGKDTQTVFSSHNWPRFGNEEVVRYIQSQRDCYQYIKDQTLRLMSQGYTIDEVGRMVTLPESLESDFFNGEFYGTVSHNAKAVYQKYLGWYDSNPVNLNKLLPTDSAKKYVDYMGGSELILKNAHKDFAKGEYQWVAEVTKQVVFADPNNNEAKLLCADALEQLGYISESGPWRNEYLSAAYELRNGMPLLPKDYLKTNVLDALNMKQLVGMIAMRVYGTKAGKENIIFNIETTDSKLKGALQLRNGVLVYLGESSENAKFTVKMPRRSLYLLATGVEEKLKYEIDNEADKATFDNFLTMLETSIRNFNIVTP